MKAEIDFKTLWSHQQQVTPPGMDELLHNIKMYRRKEWRRLTITNLLFAATSAFIVWIWIYYNPGFYTTRLGIVLVILSMAIYGLAYNRLKPQLKSIYSASSNHEYLQSMLAFNNRKLSLQTIMLNIYFVMLTLGMLLYMIEPAMNMTLVWAVGVYAAMLGWVAFNWFFVRVKRIKKQEEEAGLIIEKLKRVIDQTGE